MEERNPARRVLIAVVERRRQRRRPKLKTKMGRRRDGGCQEVGGEKQEECYKEQRQVAEASKEGFGSKRAVVPTMMTIFSLGRHVLFEGLPYITVVLLLSKCSVFHKSKYL